MMFYGLRLNWDYRKQRFCNPHFTCVVYGGYNGGAHPVYSWIDYNIYDKRFVIKPACVNMYGVIHMRDRIPGGYHML